MQVGIEIDTRELRSLADDVRMGIGEGARDAGKLAVARVNANFAAEGAREDLEPWVPTTAIALLNRKNPVTPGPSGQMGAWKTLEDTGALRESVSARVVLDSPDVIEVEVRHRTPYGDALDQGGTEVIDGAPREIPARPFLDLVDPLDLDDIENAIADAVGRALSG